MRVLFATNFSYLPQRTGGSESSTNDLCIALMEKGINVGVMCSLGMYDPVWLANRISSKLFNEKFISDMRLPYPVYRGYTLSEGIDEVINKFHPDVVIVQAGYPFELVNAFSKRNIPVVLYARDIEFHRNSESLQINKYVCFIANSKFTAGKLFDLLKVNPLVLPPLVDPSKYKVISSRTTALHIGLSQVKGVDISLALAMKRPDINFQIVESWPISKNEFLGFKKRTENLENVEILRRSLDMKKFYSSAKVLLAPSICEEAWGRVVTEAQFSGIPVLSSNRGGLPESVGEGGIIIPYDADIEQWENALSTLWDKQDIYSNLSKNALDRSQNEDISRDSIINKLLIHLRNHISSTQ